jgi:hypothetical protein
MRHSLQLKLRLAAPVTILAFTSCSQVDQPIDNAGRKEGVAQNTVQFGNGNQVAFPNQDTGSSQGQNEMMPAPADLPTVRPVANAAVAYDFRGTLSRDRNSAAVARLVIQSGPLKTARRVKFKGNLINLRNSAQKTPIDRDITVSEGGIVDFTISNLSPDTVYRIENISMADNSQEGSLGPATSLRDPYFISTAADSKLSKSRRRLIIQALSEAYDWDHSNYDSSKRYADGFGWCDRFYTWAAALEFNFSSRYGSTSFFRKYNALGDSSDITAMASTSSLAGDLVRYEGTSDGTHTFMIVAYDTATASLWTVEGNYNRRVMRNQRKIKSAWMHGHLVEGQAK